MPPYVNVAWGKFYWRDFLPGAVGKALGCCFGSCVVCVAVAMCLECVKCKKHDQ